MILNNLMDGKQLNFNQPLLSVRRGSTASPPEVNKRKTNNSHPSLPPLPFYKSELKSGPVSNPGNIPFRWEHTPGRPKDENQPQRGTLDHPPLAPKLPPGRILNHNQRPNDKLLKDSPNSSSRFQVEDNIPCQMEISCVDKPVCELEGYEEEMEDKDISSSEDDNVTFVDARDTLSRTESFSLNCSVSGLSELDGPNTEHSGGFCDPQTREFMMGRFLPAAKAMTSETPLFSSRKLPVVREQLKPVKKMVTWNKRSPRCYAPPSIVPHDVQGEEEQEEEDEVDEYDGIENLSTKLCGLLPRFCLLNPIPGMRDHSEVISSVGSVRTRTAYRSAWSKSEITHKTNISSIRGHFGRNGVVTYKNGASQSFLDRESRFRGLPEESRDFGASKLDLHKRGHTKEDFSAEHDAEEITSPGNSAMEKTLYVDYEQMIESRTSNSSSSESRGRNPSVDYSLLEIKSLCGTEISQPKNLETNVIRISSNSNQELDVEKSTQKSNPPIDLAPLLLKSPSESWLSHTLSSISKNSSSKSYLGYPTFRPPLADVKRERTLKTSNVQHMLIQPHEELAPILEN